MSIRAFCRREGFSEPGFYWWRRRLVRRAALSHQPRAAAETRSAARHGGRPTAQFVPLTVIPAGQRPLIEIGLPGGVMIRLHAGASGSLLLEVLAALVAEPVKPGPRQPAGRTVRGPQPCQACQAR